MGPNSALISPVTALKCVRELDGYDSTRHVVVALGEALLGRQRDDDRVVAALGVAVKDRFHGEDSRRRR